MITIRSSWTGAISVSLLSLPCRLGPATGDNDLDLHQVRKSDGSRIRYKRIAEADGAEVQWSEIAKGYESGDGEIVVLSDEDFSAAYGDKTRDAEILVFTDPENVPGIAAGKSYIIQPGHAVKGRKKDYDTTSAKTYALLSRALERSGKVAIVSFAISQRKHLAALRPTADGYLVLTQLLWDEDIRKPDFTVDAEVTDAEVDMAVGLIGQMSGDYSHEDQKDDSKEKLREIIRQKLEGGGNIPEVKTVDGDKAVANLMDVLQASIASTKGKAA